MSLNTIKHSIRGEIKGTLTLGVPLIASQLIYACSNFLGTAMVARLGEDALAASVLVSMIWLSLSVFFFGILNAVSVLVSHQYGAKNNKAISEIMGQAFLFGILISVPIILILSSMPLFLHWSNQPPHVLHLAYRYMRALLWTIPALVALIIGEQFLAGVGRAKIVLKISMLVVPIEIVLIYILIFGKFGLPACGVSGIGYGFAITYTVTAIALIIYLLRSDSYKKYEIFNKVFKVNLRYFKEFIRVGLPIGFIQLVEVSTFAITTFWIARFGTTVLAAHQIVMQYLGLAITVVFAMSQAVTVRVGHAVGRQDLIGVRFAIYVGIGLNFLFMLCVACIFIFMPNFILRLDVNVSDIANLNLVQNASALLFICAILMLLDNFRIIGCGALRGLKDTHFSMYMTFFSFWLVGLTSAYTLSFYFGGKGIWWGLTIGIAFGAAIVMTRLQYLLGRVELEEIAKIS